ncbi:MAG TPA: MerR family transcriptional regulator [Streptosporangiaceae bacterium]|nr:MerR family transcriptional regulator [Streptosporangiaceae bacterium]
MAHEVGFSVGAVARRLGIAPSTLRTWNRRYGIGAQELSPGRHRRYTAEDITRLEHMQKLILRGASPADAARAALGAGLAPAGSPDGEVPPARPGPGHGSGGQRLGLPGASAAARGLARAALALDESLINEIIHTALARDGVVRTWEGLLVPVLSGLGTRAERSGTCIEAEHLLSAATIAAFSGSRPDLPGRADHRPVLLACAQGDRHSLPLYALAAALAERGISTRMFGADLPYRSLAAAVRRTGPAAVFLWSQTAESGDPAAVPDLPPRRPGARLILGGPGWQRDRIPGGARLVESLPGAMAEVAAAVGRS